MVGINAYDSAVIFGSSLGHGLEHIAAAAEDDLGAGIVPAGNHGHQLGRGREGVAELPGVVDVNSLAQFLGSIVGALDEAVAEADASGVGAAAAAGEAELLKAFLHNSIAGQIAALLLSKGDGSDIFQNLIIHADGITINEDKGDIGILGSGLLQGSFLQEAGTDNDLGAVVAGSLHGIVAVIIGGLVAVGGLIILVGQAVGGSVQLNAIVSTLVEGLILQLAYVGNEADLVLAVLGGHLIGDLIGIGDDRGGFGTGIRGGSGLFTAGDHGQNHDQRESDCKNLFHLFLLQKNL